MVLTILPKPVRTGPKLIPAATRTQLRYEESEDLSTDNARGEDTQGIMDGQRQLATPTTETRHT